MLLGKNKEIFSVGFFLVFIFSAHGQAGRSYIYHFNNGLQISHEVKDDGSLIINYSIPEVGLENIMNAHGDYYRVSIPGHVPSSETGKPQLPVYSCLITVPDGAGYKIRISSITSKKLRPSWRRIKGEVFPSQESEAKRQVREKPVFRKDASVYQKRGFIPSDTVKIIKLGKARNNNLANLYISPVRYNPWSNLLEAITSMKIEITFSDTTSPVISKRITNTESIPFSRSLSSEVLNYNKYLIPGFTNKPVGMIILTDTAFKKDLQPFLEWKTQKGYKVKVLYKGAAFAGNTSAEIKNTISALYRSATDNDPAPDYLLIIGDVTRIPYYGSGYVTDMYYGEFDDGGDYIPELFTGRLPVNNNSELKTVINKIIQYEKFLFTGSNSFYSNALASTGVDAEHANYMNGQVKYSVTNYLINTNNINERHFYYPQPDLSVQKDSILKIINKGASLINYTGHGEVSGWDHINIKVVDTTLLKNKNMYPLIISNACETSKFSLPYSFGNRMVLERNKGAIGFIGSSYDTYWDEDFYWAVGLGTISDNPVYTGKGPGIFDRLFHTHNEFPADWYFTLGQINYAGNLSVSASTSSKKKLYWETYNLVGDPSVIPILGRPDSFKISLPDTLPKGIKSLTLTSEPFSYIAISHFDTLWDASYAGSSGSVSLNIPTSSYDSCLVVVTGQNRYPLIKTIHFSDIRDEFLNLTSTDINDSAANNNKRADIGESFYLDLTLSNLGSTNADGVYSKITTSSEWLTIQKDSVFIGPFTKRTDISIPDRLLLKVKDNVPDMSIASLNLTLKSLYSEKNYKIDFEIHSPVLQIISCTIDDSALGNGDRIPDPGETFNFIVRVKNLGSSDASGQLKLSGPAEGVTMLVSDVKSGLLKSGESTDIPVMIRLSDILLPGSFISLSSVLNSYPFLLNKDFTIRIGKLREGFEARSFDIFPWINSSPVPWIVSEPSPPEGIISARSGAISNNGSSNLMIRTVYPAADSLKFYYKVSSELNYDFLSFVLNGKEIFKKSGEIPWTRISVPVAAGLNKMEWIYKKDVSTSLFQDCAWVDMIDFVSAGSVNYIRKDIQIAGFAAPFQKDGLGQESVTVKLLNAGKDTINGFNMGYFVNDHIPVLQHFDNKLLPCNDTVLVTFKTKTDLSRNGAYKITAFTQLTGDEYQNNDTVRVQIENTNTDDLLNVFPNPFTDQFTIVINSQGIDNVSIMISDIKGAILYHVQKDIISGKNSITVPLEGLAPAVYYLNIRGKIVYKTIPLIHVKK